MIENKESLYPPQALSAYPELNWREATILQIIKEIRSVFNNFFDRSGIGSVLDQLPFNFSTFNSIRNLINLNHADEEEKAIIFSGIFELEVFIKTIKNHFMPVIKEVLRVSSLEPHRMVKDKDLYILRKFAACVFPENLKRLSELTSELKSICALVFGSSKNR